MSNVNDVKIMKLKEQILEKRTKLDTIKKFSPVTNCSIELDGTRYNIQVLNGEQLITLMVKLNAYRLSAEDLGVFYSISGYRVEDWIKDITARLSILSYKDEEKLLKLMEGKLNKLLSDDKKVELELNEIEDMLK